MVTMVCGFPRYERIYKSSMSTYFFARLIDESLCPSKINSKYVSYDIFIVNDSNLVLNLTMKNQHFYKIGKITKLALLLVE